MKIIFAEYIIKNGELGFVIKAVKEFVARIHKNEKRTFYEAYRRGDTLSFVHIMKFKDKKDEDKHGKASYTSEFVKVLYPRCVQEPKFTEVNLVE